MRKTKTALQISLLTLGLFFVLCPHAFAEVIHDFHSEITVNTDNSVSVIETIVYDSEGLQKHGIYRDITPRSSMGKTMDIKDVSVTDLSGESFQWQRESNNGDVRLKIGDPNNTFSGTKTYVIHYIATNAVAHLQNNLDEIYWNATGNAWPFSIEKFTAQVILPSTIHDSQNACYTGVVGSTEQGCFAGSGGFYSNRALLPGEGATVAVGFPGGVIAPYPPESFWHRYGIIFLAIIFPIVLFILLFLRWNKYGKDPKDSNVIVPEYDVPDDLTPLEVGVLLRQKSRTKDISAELIYLATQGYIKIVEIDNKIFGLKVANKYELILLKDQKDLRNEFDKILLDGIFLGAPVGTTVALSDLKNNFYTVIPGLFASVRQTVLTKQYYKNLPNPASSPFQGLLFNSITVLIVMFGLDYFIPETHALVLRNILIGSGVVVICGLIFLLFQRLMPAKTEKGIAIKDCILGLRQYLQIAEKDRLVFHNAPAKKPEIFERLLPYALVLGVENSWAKEFEGIYTTPPTWYSGSNLATFNAYTLTNNLSTFSSDASSSFTSTPSSSGGGGSGGGGFSGGGGGGGGGGSW